ncbi:DUF3429 domain-containing protein [Hyphomonas sp.]|uniref:DUF3429 domain-containing protein n=1 Tax=Hyphomonas sp. TaxID=87 RepID=UPI00391DAF10
MRLFGVPAVALGLTLAGLVPLAAGAGVMWAARADAVLQMQAAQALIVYGALILSFLGGVRWGAEVNGQGAGIPRTPLISLSVLGSLAGFGIVLWALWSVELWPVLAALAGAHLLHGVWDAGGAGLPIWMRRLRGFAAVVAVIALGAAAASYFVR